MKINIKMKNKYIVSMFLATGLLCTMVCPSASAFSFFKNKDEKNIPVSSKSTPVDKSSLVQKKTKKEKINPILTETVNKSIVKEGYKSGDKVLNVDDSQSTDERDLVIQGSVEKTLDVNLADCLKLALGNNPKIKSALSEAMASHERITEAWSNYFPELGWQSGYSKNKNLQSSAMLGTAARDFNYYLLGQVTLSQMLYDFGVTQNTVTIKKLDYEAYKTSLTATVNDVIYQVKDAYYNLLYCYENKKVAIDTVEKNEMFYKQAKAFYDIGMNPKVDVMIAEVNLSQAKLNLIEAENGIDMAVAKLNNTMGVAYFNKYNVEERLKFSPVKLSINDAFELAKESRPELKLADIKIQEANQAVKLAKKSFFPTIEAQGSYARGGASFNDSYGYNYGVYLNFPTVNGLLISAQIKEAKSLYDKQLSDAQSTKNDIYLQIQQAYLSLYEKTRQIPVALTQVRQAKENYDLSFGRYRVGAGNPTELKDAQNQYQEAQLNYYSSLYQYNSAKAALEKAIGRNILGEDEAAMEISL